MSTPMREPTFLILTALTREPMHGYGIIGEVAELSDGRLTMRPGTLYGALDRLTDEGLVEPDREEIVEGRLRRYYRLTDAGGETLAAETERLRRNVEAATARLRDRAASRPALARLRDRAAGQPTPARLRERTAGQPTPAQPGTPPPGRVPGWAGGRLAGVDITGGTA